MTNLLSAGVWQTIGSVLLAILAFLVMITVHEFGHYVVGKLLKFTILEFSIGFGPALSKRKNKKTGEVFSIRLIPLGGFCSFDGEDSADENKKDERSLQDVPFEEYDDETVVKPNAVREDSEIKPTGAKFNDQAPWKRILVLAAGAFMNYVLALLIIMCSYGFFGYTAYKVDGVEQDGYAQEVSLQQDDVILAINGVDVYMPADLVSAMNGAKKGQTVQVKVVREQKEQTVNVEVREDCNIPSLEYAARVWRSLGIGTHVKEDGNSYYSLSTQTLRCGFFETIGRSFVYSFKLGGTVLTSFGELLTGKMQLTSMGGPIATIEIASQVAQQGFADFLNIVALIGVNLAVFNLLPIPALDGSKIVFCAIEWIFKKPVPRKIEAIIHLVGMLFIFGFAILVDVLHFI